MKNLKKSNLKTECVLTREMGGFGRKSTSFELYKMNISVDQMDSMMSIVTNKALYT